MEVYVIWFLQWLIRYPLLLELSLNSVPIRHDLVVAAPVDQRHLMREVGSVILELVRGVVIIQLDANQGPRKQERKK